MEDPCLSVLLSTVASPADEDFDLWPTCSSSTTTSASASASSSTAPTPSPSTSLIDDDDSLGSIDSSDKAFDTCFPNFDFNVAAAESDIYSSNLFNSQTDWPETETRQKDIFTEETDKNRTQECSMICWLFRTLLTSEYRALPLNAIFELYERTIGRENGFDHERRLPTRCSPRIRHARLCIRYVLFTSNVFVRVLTPNPRKDFLVISEAGNWWTVQPAVEETCAMDVLTPGAVHKCPQPIKSNNAHRISCTLNKEWSSERKRELAKFNGARISGRPVSKLRQLAGSSKCIPTGNGTTTSSFFVDHEEIV